MSGQFPDAQRMLQLAVLDALHALAASDVLECGFAYHILLDLLFKTIPTQSMLVYNVYPHVPSKLAKCWCLYDIYRLHGLFGIPIEGCVQDLRLVLDRSWLGHARLMLGSF